MFLRLSIFATFAFHSLLVAGQSPVDSAPLSPEELKQYSIELESRNIDLTQHQRTTLLDALQDKERKIPSEIKDSLLPILRGTDERIPVMAIQILLSSKETREAFADHADPVIRFIVNYQLAKTGDAKSSERLFKMMHDTSMSRQDARFIKTQFLVCGLNPKTDNANAILKHLKKLARPFPLLQPGDAVPDFQFTDVDGKTSKLKDLQGKIVIIHFWAQWCGPCMAQMDALCARLGKLPADKVVILFVNLDFDLKTFEAERKKLTLPCRHICDTAAVRGTIPVTFGVNYIPVDVVIDAHGKIAAYDLNAVSDAGALKAIGSRTKR